jgi:hypothetical protein
MMRSNVTAVYGARYGVSISTFWTHYIVFLLIFVRYAIYCFYFTVLWDILYSVLLLFVGHTIYCFYWYFWDMLCNVSVGTFGTHYIVFLLVFVGTLYIASIGILGHYTGSSKKMDGI